MFSPSLSARPDIRGKISICMQLHSTPLHCISDPGPHWQWLIQSVTNQTNMSTSKSKMMCLGVYIIENSCSCPVDVNENWERENIMEVKRKLQKGRETPNYGLEGTPRWYNSCIFSLASQLFKKIVWGCVNYILIGLERGFFKKSTIAILEDLEGRSHQSLMFSGSGMF